MLKNELIYYMKSKTNVLIWIVMLIPVCLSYFDTRNEYYLRDFSVMPIDVRTGGLSYYFSFVVSEYYTIMAIIALAIFSCLVSTRLYDCLSNGFGNLQLMRNTYKNILIEVLCAQLIYITITITAFAFCLFLVSHIVYPYQFDAGPLWGNLFSIKLYSLKACFKWFLLLLLPLVFYLNAVYAITSLVVVYVRNRYVLQTLPIIIFLVPFLCSNVFQNVCGELVIFSRTLSLYDFLTCIFDLVDQPIGFGAPISQRIANVIVIPIVSVITIRILYKKNLRTFEKDYL